MEQQRPVTLNQRLVLTLAFGVSVYTVIWSTYYTLQLHYHPRLPNENKFTVHKQSTCGPQATARGPHQKVISYSFYGGRHHPKKYYEGIWVNADRVLWLYPGWVMRVYHDVKPGTEFRRELEEKATKYTHLDLCYVGQLPRYGNLTGMEQMTWRFLAMADPLVDVFLSRDVDAMPLERETAAVNQWLASNLTFHVMRDHIYHNVVMPGGMWGARLEFRRHNLRKIADKLCSFAKSQNITDQKLLKQHLWPSTQGEVMQHDCYFCGNSGRRAHGHVTPFPTRRNETAPFNFVGNVMVYHVRPVLNICPESCRPREHLDWRYC